MESEDKEKLITLIMTYSYCRQCGLYANNDNDNETLEKIKELIGYEQ